MANNNKGKKKLEDRGLYSKFVISTLFMFILPVLLACYLFFFVFNESSVPPDLQYVKLIMLWMVLSGVLGYMLNKSSVKETIKLIDKAKDVSEGRFKGKIETLEQNELKDLAMAFNRLTSEMENKIRELEYSRGLARELFQKIGYAITSSQQIGSLLMLINQSTRKVFSADASFIALYDKDDSTLKLRAYSGPQKNLCNDASFPKSEGVLNVIIKTGKPMILKKPIENKTAQGIAMSNDEPLMYSNILCVPIISKSEAKGVIAVCDLKNTDKIDSEDLFLLENISSQVATSVSNFELSKNIEETYYQTLVTLAKAVEAKDPYSAGHLERVTGYAERMADKLHLDSESKKMLKGGALLHDLGKLGIQDNILKKEGKFSDSEYEIMKTHASIGEDILKPLRSMSKLSKIVRHHHESYDGNGYPDKLKGDEIPLLSRILSVVDVYDALSTERPYKRAMAKGETIKELKKAAYNKLDPKLVNVFIGVLEDIDKEGWK